MKKLLSTQQWRLISLLLFMTALLPRALYPVSRPEQWYRRSILFGDALLSGDWVATYQQYHPGVTTMWIAGVWLKLYGWWQGATSAELLRYEPDGTAAGVLGLALVIAAGIVLIFWLLYRLTNPLLAVAAGFMLALEPLYIANSQVLHVDALLTTFMFVSVLLLLLYRQDGRRRFLLAAGVVAGLAGLTKTPSLLLFPFAGLLLLTHHLGQALPAGDERRRSALVLERARVGRWLWATTRDYLLWLLALAGTYLLLWPVMWLHAGTVLSVIWEETFRLSQTPHKYQTFFRGGFVNDPGVLFYLFTISFRVTFLSLLTAGLGLFMTVSEVRWRRWPHRHQLWWILLYGVLFAAMMSLSAKKAQRYLLPLFPVLSVFAGVGIAWLGRLAARRVAPARAWRTTWLIIAGALGLQLIILLPYHPYYGTHYNHLLGGAAVAADIVPLQNQAEGVDLAAQWLRQQPDAAALTVTVRGGSGTIIQRFFPGRVLRNNDRPAPAADFRIYTVNGIMRELWGERWDDAWVQDQQREPVFTAEFNGITYVWVYANEPLPDD